jgi:Ca-activated chloride channel family protein
MGPADRLPLLKQGFRLFSEQLRDEDRVSIGIACWRTWKQ